MKTNRFTGAIALIAVTFLSGCAVMNSYKEERALLMNPQRTNATADNRPSNVTTRAFNAQEIQVKAYYASLQHAQTDYNVVPAQRASPEAIANYIDEGIALNIAFCRRWFHRIDDAQRQFQWGGKDMNIITALGTTALGLLEASTRTVAIYGAASTAVAGFGENFNAALLTAPGAKNVESKVMLMMANYGAQLRSEARGLRFAEAYTRLETHADICTFSSIRDVVNSSLTQADVSVSPSGTIMAAPPVATTYQKDDSGERIIAYWSPADVVNEANQARIRKWLDSHGFPVSITFFAHGKLYEAARKQLVADLALPEIPK